jgi:hypothetical protein
MSKVSIENSLKKISDYPTTHINRDDINLKVIPKRSENEKS